MDYPTSDLEQFTLFTPRESVYIIFVVQAPWQTENSELPTLGEQNKPRPHLSDLIIFRQVIAKRKACRARNLSNVPPHFTLFWYNAYSGRCIIHKLRARNFSFHLENRASSNRQRSGSTRSVVSSGQCTTCISIPVIALLILTHVNNWLLSDKPRSSMRNSRRPEINMKTPSRYNS